MAQNLPLERNNREKGAEDSLNLPKFFISWSVVKCMFLIKNIKILAINNKYPWRWWNRQKDLKLATETKKENTCNTVWGTSWQWKRYLKNKNLTWSIAHTRLLKRNRGPEGRGETQGCPPLGCHSESWRWVSRMTSTWRQEADRAPCVLSSRTPLLPGRAAAGPPPESPPGRLCSAGRSSQSPRTSRGPIHLPVGSNGSKLTSTARPCGAL